MKPRTTILIPTREGMITLPGTLDSCLAVASDELEILVSDNQSPDGTREYVLERAKTDSRLRYVQAPARMGMAEHWEFAVGQVRTDYVCAIGDDDAVMPGFMEELTPAMDAGAELVSWPICAFIYADTNYCSGGMLSPGSLHLPLESFDGPQSTKDVVAQFLRAEVYPQHLRGVYHGACRVSLLQRFREQHGRLFLLPSNDTAAYLLPFYTEVDWRISQPISLYAMSKKSQAGALVANNPEADRSRDEHWRAERTTEWCTGLGDLPASATQIIDFITGMLRFGMIDQRRYEEEVNWTVYVARAWNELGPRLFRTDGDRSAAFEMLRRFAKERAIGRELSALIEKDAPRNEKECWSMLKDVLDCAKLFPFAPALETSFTMEEAPHARDVARLFPLCHRKVSHSAVSAITERESKIASLRQELMRCKASWRSRGTKIDQLKARLASG